MSDNNCANCVHKISGFDGKPSTCGRLAVADIWNGFDKLEKDGVGYSDENWEGELAVLYVGEEFGCIKFKQK